MADKIFEPAFNREAAELTRKLRFGSGYLLYDETSNGWDVWSCRNRFAKAVGKTAASLVNEMEARGLLKPRPGGGLMLAQAMARSKVEVADPDGRTVIVERNDAECALDWLRGRKDLAGGRLFSEELFAAAERLRRDYTLAHMEQRMTASWDRPIESGSRGRSQSSSHPALGDRALAAKQRLFTALSHVGPELSGILLEICCMASGLENAERLLGLPRRSGKAILQMGLSRLARHYGLLPDEAPRLAQAGLRRWAAPDYRPRIA